ncbi:sphingomyelin phosphodiesterase 5 [Lampris incognitus]|uniref:sphingomyelin phosphodiesterase 5 n=1 Tax=Lampris incognitus TaxID=2546036 RepID=UPI0024B5F6B4|nr:sphingomyelin phosphodiesterase 5 [Lampris incognitus]
MALRVSPFPNGFVAGVHAVGWALILPCFWFLDRLIAVCMSTTQERTQRLEQCHLHPLKVFFGSVVFFLLFLISAPFAFLGFLLWAPLQACRRPFAYHRKASSSLEKETNQGFELSGKASFGFATANLCLLPDSLARFNNLGHTQQRATAIGQHIVQGVSRPHIRVFVDSPSSCGTLSPSSSLLPTANPSVYGATESQAHPPVIESLDGNSVEEEVTVPSCGHVPDTSCNDSEDSSASETPTPLINTNHTSNQQERAVHKGTPRALHSRGMGQGDDVPWEVSSLFPANVDILCLAEVFDKRAAKKLKDALRPLFGHILYDVGIYACHPPGCCSSFKFFNSGLFLASRFPVLEAKYHCFPNGRGEDALAAKGLLSVKVLIGQDQKRKEVVGFFNCTHLHAPEGEGEIRCEQLNMITQWIGEFQAVSKRPEEVVVFDVLCGDFNFDNCSPDDGMEQKHALFELYSDPCRAGPGKEKSWAIGTLLEQPTLYEEHVRTPENLQRTLEQEELRKQFISPPVPAVGCPLAYPDLGHPWVGRRIDYVLYRESSIAEHCRTEIEEFTYVTQLAGLTDHIPVGLRLNVIMDSECAGE